MRRLASLAVLSAAELAAGGDRVAYLVAWTERPEGRGRMLDVGIFSEATPTGRIGPGAPHSHVLAQASSSRRFGPAKAKLLASVKRRGLFPVLMRYKSFASGIESDRRMGDVGR